MAGEMGAQEMTRVAHKVAARVALEMLEAEVEGAEIIAQYVDQQSAAPDWERLSDREWSNVAAKRADDAAGWVDRLSQAIEGIRDRVASLERQIQR